MQFVYHLCAEDFRGEELLPLKMLAMRYPAQRRQVEKFRQIHASLRQNTAEKAAQAVLGVLDAGAG